MANKRISSLTSLGAAPATDDIIPITDISDTTGSAQGTTKKVTVANLHSGLQAEPAEGAFVDGDKTKLDGINISTFGATLVDDTDASAARTTLGLGTAATSASTDFSSAFFNVVSETTTARTLSDSDNKKVIVCSNSSAVTITLPTGLTSGFSCTVVQNGTGTVKIEGGAAISAINNINATVGQYGHLNVLPIGSDAYLIEGEGQRLFANVNSLSFDGVNDEAQSGSNMPLGSSGEFSVVAWFKTSDTDSSHEVILGFGTSSKYFALRISSSNTTIRENSTNTTLGQHSTTDWNFVAAYHDGTNLKGSLNGGGFISASRNNTYQTADFQNPIKIGELPYTTPSNSSSTQPFPGLIDEVAWWDSAVSESDLITIYNSGVPLNLTSYSPNHWWRMGDADGGTGSIVSDEIGSNNLTIYGATFSTDVPS